MQASKTAAYQQNQKKEDGTSQDRNTQTGSGQKIGKLTPPLISAFCEASITIHALLKYRRCLRQSSLWDCPPATRRLTYWIFFRLRLIGKM